MFCSFQVAKIAEEQQLTRPPPDYNAQEKKKLVPQAKGETPSKKEVKRTQQDDADDPNITQVNNHGGICFSAIQHLECLFYVPYCYLFLRDKHARVNWFGFTHSIFIHPCSLAGAASNDQR